MFNLFSKTNRVVGLDINNRYLRFVEILRAGGEERITAYGEATSDKDIFENGTIADPIFLASALRDIKKEIRTNDCIVSLPGDQTRFLRLTLHHLKSGRAKHDISAFLQSKGVMTFDEEILCFELIGQSDIESQYSVILIQRKLFREYQEIFRALHFKVKKFLISGQALINSCVPRDSQTSFLILSAEDSTASLALASGSDPAIFYHGDGANHNIISILNRTHIEWYDEKKEKIHYTLVAGARGKDVAFLDYVARETRIPITRANVFVNLSLDRQKVPIIPKDDSGKYAVAIGLAIS